MKDLHLHKTISYMSLSSTVNNDLLFCYCCMQQIGRWYGTKVNEPHHEKTKVLVSDLVRHKPGCTATEDGWRLDISDLENGGIVLSM